LQESDNVHAHGSRGRSSHQAKKASRWDQFWSVKSEFSKITRSCADFVTFQEQVDGFYIKIAAASFQRNMEA
jgi:hypothetical protein